MSGGDPILYVDMHGGNIKPEMGVERGLNMLKINPNKVSAASVRGWIKRVVRKDGGSLHSMVIYLNWRNFTSVGADLLKSGVSVLNTIHGPYPNVPIDALLIQTNGANFEDIIGILPSLPKVIHSLTVSYCKIPEAGVPTNIWEHLPCTETFHIHESGLKSVRLVRPCENK